MNTSTLLQIKSDILKDGVDFEPYNLFTNLSYISAYKVKKIKKQPKVVNGKVYDMSEDENVIPSEVLLKDGIRASVVKLRYNPSSKLTIKLNENTEGELIIQNNGEVIENIKMQMLKKYEILNKETPFKDDNHVAKVKEFVDVVGVDRISVLLFDGCYNWNCGNPCKFCDLHPKEKRDFSCRPSVNDLEEFNSVRDWWYANREKYLDGIKYSMKEVLENIKFDHKHLLIMSGNLKNSKQVWYIAEDIIRDMSSYINFDEFDSYLNIAPHDNIEQLKRIKSLGIKQVQYNLEIANKDLFEYTCPGKIKYEEFVNKLIEAVEVMGRGNVRTNFVFGLQPTDELVEEVEKLAEKGVVSDYSVFQPKKNTPYVNKKSPEFEEVKYFTERLVDTYIKYGYKPIYCSMSSRSSIVNELYEEKNSRNIQ